MMAARLASPDEVTTLIQRSFDAIAAGVSAGSKVLEWFLHMHQMADQFATMGLLPLCVALLVLHENARAATEGSPFRPLFVLGRVGITIALLLGYPTVCKLITHVAGWGGHFMNADQYESLSDWDKSKDALSMAWDNSSLGSFMGIFFVWMIVMVAALFAYIANVLLSTSQGVLLTILLALGKLCIIASMVPGISVVKGWARSLAQVAAWSTVGGIIAGLLSVRNDSIRTMMATGQLSAMFKLAGQFIILALCTLSIPLIVARIFSGAAPHAVGAMGAIMAGFMGGRILASGVAGGVRSARDRARKGGPAGGDSGGDRRLHKVPISQRVAGVPQIREVEIAAHSIRAEKARQQRFEAADSMREAQANTGRDDIESDTRADHRSLSSDEAPTLRNAAQQSQSASVGEERTVGPRRVQQAAAVLRSGGVAKENRVAASATTTTTAARAGSSLRAAQASAAVGRKEPVGVVFSRASHSSVAPRSDGSGPAAEVRGPRPPAASDQAVTPVVHHRIKPLAPAAVATPKEGGSNPVHERIFVSQRPDGAVRVSRRPPDHTPRDADLPASMPREVSVEDITS